MIGLEIVAPKGLAFVSWSCHNMCKGAMRYNGYNDPSVRDSEGCDKIKGGPTRLMITMEIEIFPEQWFSCVMTDKDGNITPWAGKIILKKMIPQELAIPADGGSVAS